MDVEAVKSVHLWFCAAAGSCAASFVVTTMPYLQFVAVIIAIAAGIKSLFGNELKRLWKRLK